MLRTLLVLVGLAAAADLRADEVAQADLAKALESASRHERFEALSTLENAGDLPAAMIGPVANFIRIDLRQVFLSQPLRVRGGGKIPNPLPFDGTETSLVRLKANVTDYVNKPFVMCGAIAVDDYYNFGYENAKDSHYSFKFERVSEDGEIDQSDRASLYLQREIGRGLVDDVAAGAERKPGTSTLVRVTCTVLSRRLEASDTALRSIELLDWQFMDTISGKWSPKTLDGLRSGLKLLKTADSAAAATLVGLGLGQGTAIAPAIDERVRAMIGETLTELSNDGRRAALAELRQALPKARDARAHQWALTAARGLGAGTAKALKANASQAPDRSAKAESELRIGLNLEKSGKLDAAARQYRNIMKEYSDQPAAEKAAARLKALQTK